MIGSSIAHFRISAKLGEGGMGEGEIRVVATGGRTFEPGAPVTLFSYPIVSSAGSDDSRTYDITADGKRIVAISIPEATRPRRLEVVTEWLPELERLVP